MMFLENTSDLAAVDGLRERADLLSVVGGAVDGLRPTKEDIAKRSLMAPAAT